MLPIILLLVIIVLIVSYCWWEFAPYFKFVNHVWIDWNLLRIICCGTDVERGNLIFQKFNTLCRQNEKDGVFILWAAKPTLIAFGEDAVKFFSSETSLVDKPKIYDLFKFMGETSIFVSSGKRFKKIKKIMMAAFYPNVIKNIVPVMNYHATCLVKTLEETNGAVTENIEAILKNHALRTFLEASMGIKADTEENKIKINRLVILFIKLLALASYRVYSPWLHSDFMLKFSSIGREYVKLQEELHSITKEVLEDIKENVLSHSESEKNPSRPKSLGEVLIEQHFKDPSFDMEEVGNQVTGILTGGYDTTSTTLMWCFLLLGHHQDIQQKAYEEVTSLTNGDLEYEDGRNLTYLECILKETLRLYPPAPVYARKPSKDLIFGKHTVPKGTTILIYLYQMHRNAKLYSKPDDFIPERFADNGSNIKPWTHIPFAEGARSCIGKHFAMLEMKVALAHVLRKFRIVSLDRPGDVKIVFEVILKCEKPLRMQFIPRQ